MRFTKWLFVVVTAAVLLPIGFALALEAGYLHPALTSLFGAHTHRHIRVNGSFQIHLFAAHPQFVAEQVSIDNPSWMPAGSTAEVQRLTLVFASPRFGHWLSVQRLVMDGAILHLVRDSAGRANWQLTEPNGDKSGELPLIRSLSMPNARATLDDARRHLRFSGVVSATEQTEPGEPHWLHLTGTGELNDAAVTMEVISDPLATASHTQPYRFTFSERSKDSRLSGSGALSHAFSFDVLDTTFEATGRNMKDLYQLTGVTLINSGRFQLSGKMVRQGTTTTVSDLHATTGTSDVRGTVAIETKSDRSMLSVQLHSDLLRVSDLGERAAQREFNTASEPKLLFSDAALNPASARRADAQVTFHAQRVELGRVPLQQVAVNLTINRGKLAIAPMTATVLDGKLELRSRTDATSDTPISDIQLRLNGVQLGKLDRTSPGAPRFDAPMDAQLEVTGTGRSLHQLAAHADGSITTTLSAGVIRASLAELSDVDLRSLKLLLSKSQRQTGIRCAIARFQIHQGNLTSQSIVMDTDQVLIKGEGSIAMNSEAMDLTFRGDPKGVRLFRLNAPVQLRGTLLHPRFGLEGPKSLKLVDRGQAQDVDCASLAAQ